jgi:hypothetical protein
VTWSQLSETKHVRLRPHAYSKGPQLANGQSGRSSKRPLKFRTSRTVSEAYPINAIIGHAFNDNASVGDTNDTRAVVSCVTRGGHRFAWAASVVSAIVSVTNDRADPVRADLKLEVLSAN